jgi:hypothetical protein
MVFSNNPLYNSLKVYIIIIILLIYFKPNFLYDKKQKQFKSFGLDKNSTIFSFPILSIFLAILIYFIFSIIDKYNYIQNEYNRLITHNK